MTWLRPQHRDPVPFTPPSLVSAPFWEGVAAGELRYQRCADCGSAVFNPAPVCRTCTSTNLGWEVSAGRGSVYSWTICHRPMSPAFTTPYAPVIVDLDEGFQMLSNLVECDTDDVEVGLRVEVLFHPNGDRSIPYFRPTDG